LLSVSGFCGHECSLDGGGGDTTDNLDKDKTGVLDEADVVRHLDDRGE